MSSSNSQNFPRTFFRLTSKWDKKAGRRNSTQSIWADVGVSQKEPVSYVPCVMSGLFENQSQPEKMYRRLCEIQPTGTREAGNQVWIYNMRTSDPVPRTFQDEQKLYSFVRTMLNSWCDRDTFRYMEKHIHICVCFFVWYFTKENFFYSDKVIRQTTRNGIQRVWTGILIGKEPISSHARMLSEAPARTPIITTDTLLPKQQQQQEKLKTDIELMFSSTTVAQRPLVWEDSQHLHVKVSECITNSSSGLSVNQTKKLQKMYNEYITITAKINKTLEKIRKVERANAKIVLPTQTTGNEPGAWARELGAPPPIPLLRRYNAEFEAASDTPPMTDAHMGGCAPDDDVPESWEDL